MTVSTDIFSDYEIRAMSIKLDGSDAFKSADCTGSVEEEMETKQVTKSCRGVVVKKVVKGTGNGTLTITAHMPYDLFVGMFGMIAEELVDGVYAYGRNSKHPKMCIVMDTYDEDDVQKFRAYPNCVMNTGVVRSVENGAEEVAQLELEVGVMPDEYGFGLYECKVSDIGEDTKQLKTKWMTAFEPSLVQVAAV